MKRSPNLEIELSLGKIRHSRTFNRRIKINRYRINFLWNTPNTTIPIGVNHHWISTRVHITQNWRPAISTTLQAPQYIISTTQFIVVTNNKVEISGPSLCLLNFKRDMPLNFATTSTIGNKARLYMVNYALGSPLIAKVDLMIRQPLHWWCRKKLRKNCSDLLICNLIPR